MNDGGPAFPVICQDLSKYQVCEGGMTLRDWFAGRAMAGFIREDAVVTWSEVATWSYELADAMLAEKEKRDNSEPEKETQ